MVKRLKKYGNLLIRFENSIDFYMPYSQKNRLLYTVYINYFVKNFNSSLIWGLICLPFPFFNNFGRVHVWRKIEFKDLSKPLNFFSVSVSDHKDSQTTVSIFWTVIKNWARSLIWNFINPPISNDNGYYVYNSFS